jgi:hypothetical protein
LKMSHKTKSWYAKISDGQRDPTRLTCLLPRGRIASHVASVERLKVDFLERRRRVLADRCRKRRKPALVYLVRRGY